MMYLETPPRLIATQVFSAMPAEFRRNVRSDWADANRPGAPTDCFIEGPSFDADGNLYIVDIPFGRIFRISPDRKWTLVVEYDGWPNGLKIDAKGRILVADYMHGHHGARRAGRENAADPHRAQFGVVQGLQRPAYCARTATSISPTRARPACMIRPAASIACAQAASSIA